MALQFCSWKWDCTTRDKAQLSEPWNCSILCSNMERKAPNPSQKSKLFCSDSKQTVKILEKKPAYLSFIGKRRNISRAFGKAPSKSSNGCRDSLPKRVEKNIWVLRKYLWKLRKKITVHIPKTKQAACSLYPSTSNKASHLENKSQHSQ